jgi:hypothetical protein
MLRKAATQTETLISAYIEYSFGTEQCMSAAVDTVAVAANAAALLRHCHQTPPSFHLSRRQFILERPSNAVCHTRAASKKGLTSDVSSSYLSVPTTLSPSKCPPAAAAAASTAHWLKLLLLLV